MVTIRQDGDTPIPNFHPIKTLRSLGWGLLNDPPMRQPLRIEQPLADDDSASLPRVPVGEPIKLLLWNIQFGAGRTRLFFYDGGRACHVPEAERDKAMNGIVQEINRINPDIVMLQEVDRGADRTGRIDQHIWLKERCQLPSSTSAWMHRSPYVPVPLHEPMGKVDLHLGVYSKFHIRSAVRHALPKLNESRLRQAFNLKRAVLQASLPLADGDDCLDLFNLHFSAFSRGDGTLAKQVERLQAMMADSIGAHRPVIAGGDFNCLPPGDDPHRLGEHAELYEAATPIAPLFDSLQPARSPAECMQTGTWVPLGSNVPDRTLDHAFAGPRIQWLDASVPFHPDSDHLPVVLTFRVLPTSEP